MNAYSITHTPTIAFFKKEGIASNLCGCTGSFQSGSTTADNNHVAVFVYMQFLIYIALKNRRVYGTADRTVYTDTVSGASNVTGDTFALWQLCLPMQDQR